MKEVSVAIQIVMDRVGDTRHYFDINDPESLAEAEHRFNELVALGFAAAARIVPGEVSKISAFDPVVEETLFVPRLVGG
jgi:hypothetical protein